MITQETMASWKCFSMMERMEADHSHSAFWISTLHHCWDVLLSRDLLVQKAGRWSSTSLFHEFKWFQENLMDHEPKLLTVASEVAKLAAGHVKAGDITWEEIHPAAVQSTLWRRGAILASSISIKCSFPIKRKGEKKGRKRRDGCLLKYHPPHWQTNETPNVHSVYFCPHWRKNQSHNFLCSVSDQHKHTKAEVHFYPLEQFSLMRTGTLLSHRNVHAHNLIYPLPLIFEALSDLWKINK